MKDEMIITIKVGALNDPDEMHIPLRPLFAGLAMCGVLSNSSLVLTGDDEEANRDAVARAAWHMADAMLKRGDEKPQEEEVPE